MPACMWLLGTDILLCQCLSPTYVFITLLQCSMNIDAFDLQCERDFSPVFGFSTAQPEIMFWQPIILDT
jgi:hypothetical protein